MIALQESAETTLSNIKKLTYAHRGDRDSVAGRKLIELQDEYQKVHADIDNLFASLRIKNQEEFNSYSGTFITYIKM